MSREDPAAATGQMPYEPNYCECAHLVTLHAFNTKGQRAACSASTCDCRRFAGESRSSEAVSR